MIGVAASLGWMGCAGSSPRALEMLLERQEWVHEDRGGHRMATPHFDIYTTTDNPPLVDALPEFMETAYREYQTLLPEPREDSQRLTTYIFGSRSQWDRFIRERYAPTYSVYQYIRSGGFTEGRTAVLFYTVPSTTLATIAHEGWHQYVSRPMFPEIPPWLNEGLGCYFEAFDFTRRPPRFTPLNNAFRLDRLRQARLTERLFSLEELLTLDAGQVLRKRQSSVTQTYYAQTWALILFLKHGDAPVRRRAFDALMAHVGDSTLHPRVRAASLADRTVLPHENLSRAVFEVYFGKVNERLSREYQDYINELVGF